MQPKAAIYCRLSEEDRDKQSENEDSGSIQNQKSMLTQYAKEQGWSIYNIYSDDDYTGADRNRPEFQKLLQDAKNRKFNIVLCKTQSRFTRELELVEKYIHGLFPLWNIRFISIVDNADTANKGNKKSRQINGLVNEWYLEDMSENIKSVLNDRRKKGYHIGSFALYGYKKDPDRKGHLIIDEEAAKIVREVFTLFSKGYGKTAIARILNDRGVPNPTEYKRLHGLCYTQPAAKLSTMWKYSAISSMLSNEIYIGNMVQGKYGSISYKTKKNKPKPREEWYRVEGTHDPVIDRELWNRVQELIKQRAKPFTAGTIGLFAKKVRCMNCGYTMRSSKNHNKYYLKCSSRHVSDDACIGAFISVEKLEQAVLAELNKLTAICLDKREVEQRAGIHIHTEKEIENWKNDAAVFQKKAKEYEKGIRELYLDKVRGIISEDNYLDFAKNFTAERKRYESMMLQTEKRIADIQKMRRNENSCDLVEQYTKPEHLTREIVDMFVDYILVGKRNPDKNEISVEIHWNF